MFDDVEALFVEHVVPAYRAFIESVSSGPAGSSKDLRLAVNAATALHHFREHVPTATQKTRGTVAALCPDYDLLGDIVDATKHHTLTRKSQPLIRSANDVYEEIS